ncbi:MAG: AAA-like domain-containing protein [Beijerinckiaceae bacterium]
MSSHHRLNERAEIAKLLRQGASILMLAPRRIGKTWLMHEVAKDLVKENWNCISLDVQGMDSEEKFLRALCGEIEKQKDLKKRMLDQLRVRAKQAFENAESLSQALGKVDHRQFLEVLVESLNAEKARSVIMIDEIALFILVLSKKDPEATRGLLYHLRKLQLAFRNVSWFLTGSVGLDIISRRFSAEGALLDYESYILEPFTELEARSYMQELCDKGPLSKQFQFENNAFQTLTNALGWLSPYYIRQIANCIRPSKQIAAPGTGDLATSDDVLKAVDLFLTPNYRLHFSPWKEHIEKNFDPPDTKRLQTILNIASEQDKGEIEATFLTRLNDGEMQVQTRQLKDDLIVLQKDGYLVKTDNRWKFQSGLLRRYWQEYAAS